MNKTLFILISLTAILFGGCGNDENLDDSLFATWQVTKVEGLYYYNNFPLTTATDSDPTGTVEFKEDGTGYQNYSFQLGGNTYPNIGAFSWESNDGQIIIDRLNEPDMVWERVTKLTNKQVAKYTIVVDANQKWDYTLTLEK